ncbi:MAG: bacteriohopanetetrol glucosamine biosynthesis glycosyltransferase HpnI [Gammaproteobacteria bacterium]|nr:bacteriohopanetetrol glucosamine biosynthesis glycosyltransferase HpnI [Gammaproteobacteria bacterium]
MPIDFYYLLLYPTGAICVLSFGYLFFSLFVIERFRIKRHDPKPDFHPPVTIFKPVCGLDTDMAANLRSFCEQDYPEYQVIFGVQKQDDPALDVIHHLIKELPDVDMRVIVNPRLHGSNHKVSNLINMYPHAMHDYVLIADSDMRVPPDYLANVMAPFASPEVGAVTCLYSGEAKNGIASALNAMFINSWFLPSVLISEMIEKTRFCLGATMAVRRDVLEKVGGLCSLKDHLADDYMLGKLVTDAGYRIHLSHYVVTNVVHEPGFRSLYLHELRWARTLRTVEPVRYAMTFLTDTVVIALVTATLALLAGAGMAWPLAIVLLAVAARILLHLRVKSALGLEHAGSVLLIPLRDLLSFFIRAASFTGSAVHWRNHDFSVDSEGLIHEYETAIPLTVEEEEIVDLATNQDY